MTADDQVRELLNQLGPTPDAVADRLRALGIKGNGSCGPIEAYLYRYADGISSVRMGLSTLSFRTLNDVECSITLPTPVIFFLSRLERGVYLDLCELPSERAS